MRWARLALVAASLLISAGAGADGFGEMPGLRFRKSPDASPSDDHRDDRRANDDSTPARTPRKEREPEDAWVRQRPSEADLANHDADSSYDRGLQAFKGHDYDGAIAAFTAALRGFQTVLATLSTGAQRARVQQALLSLALAENAKGVALFRQHDPEGALVWVTRARDRFPSRKPFAKNVAIVQAEVDRRWCAGHRPLAPNDTMRDEGIEEAVYEQCMRSVAQGVGHGCEWASESMCLGF